MISLKNLKEERQHVLIDRKIITVLYTSTGLLHGLELTNNFSWAPTPKLNTEAFFISG